MRKNSKAFNTVSSPGHLIESKTLKPATAAGFRFMDIYHSQGVVMKFINYKPAKIVKAKHHWYVEYQYKGPDMKWHRFRVYEDINRFKNDEYNKLLLEAVNKKLAEGFNPFERKEDPVLTPSELSLNSALDLFMEYCKSKGLRPKSLITYNETVRMLKDYFTRDNQIFRPLSYFTREKFKQFGDELTLQRKWENSTYNKRMENIRTIFNWFVKEGKIDRNPLLGIESKKTIATRHKYFESDLLERLKADVAKDDPYLLSFLEFLYYTCTRPKSEARLLRVEHLLFDRHMLYVPGEISKNKRSDYIPLAPELEAKLQHLKKFPGNYYMWGKNGPEAEPASPNYFAIRFKPFKDALGLNEDYTMYGLKHTRAIDLANAKVDPYAIMKLMRHSGLDVTMKYLRDLGCDVDWSKYEIDKKF